MTQKKSTDGAIILQAMVSVAAADGDLDKDELATIRTVYEQITGEMVSTDDINSTHITAFGPKTSPLPNSWRWSATG